MKDRKNEAGVSILAFAILMTVLGAGVVANPDLSKDNPKVVKEYNFNK
jgi:hypothetical protein